MPDIVKVQRALFPPDAPALIYDRHRRRSSQQPLDRATAKALRGDPKGYFEATYSGGRWRIGKRVEDLPW